jgi:hypothetical protein
MFMSFAASATVTVTSPKNGATVPTTSSFVASATSSYPVIAIAIYVDNHLAYKVNAASLNTPLTMSAGAHYVVVQAWDSAGAVQKTALNVTATAPVGGVTITSPANGATVAGNVHFAASATSAAPIIAMGIYADSALQWKQNVTSVDTYVTLPAGAHYVVVQAWDSTGAVYKSAANITVSSSPAVVPSYATVLSNLDQRSGWQSCTVCAGANGNGPSAPYSMTQNVSSPSMDGTSTQFWIGNSGTVYADALWWNQLGANSAATNFVYDLYFYLTDPNAAQSLEFDVNQAVNGYKYIFGTQCDVRNKHVWDVWDTANKLWISTGLACNPPTAYTWHHLVWQFQRVNGQVKFVAFTLDAVTHYVNMTFNPQASSVAELNVAFQMDGNYAQTPYSVWLDKVTLSYW